MFNGVPLWYILSSARDDEHADEILDNLYKIVEKKAGIGRRYLISSREIQITIAEGNLMKIISETKECSDPENCVQETIDIIQNYLLFYLNKTAHINSKKHPGLSIDSIGGDVNNMCNEAMVSGERHLIKKLYDDQAYPYGVNSLEYKYSFMVHMNVLRYSELIIEDGEFYAVFPFARSFEDYAKEHEIGDEERERIFKGVENGINYARAKNYFFDVNLKHVFIGEGNVPMVCFIEEKVIKEQDEYGLQELYFSIMNSR